MFKTKQAVIVEKIINKSNLWKEEHPTASYSSPWSVFSLDPEKVTDDGKIWMNPQNQDFVPSGWFSVTDLECFLNEGDSFLKDGKTFAQLKEYCETARAHMYDYKPNHHEPKYIRKFSDLVIKGIHDNKLGKWVVKEIEQHVKFMYREGLGYMNNGEYNIGSILENNFLVSKQSQDEVFAFFRTLHMMGFGEYAAINTPRERWNLSFWRDQLENEVYYELFQVLRIRKHNNVYYSLTKKNNNIIIQFIVMGADGKFHIWPEAISVGFKDVEDESDLSFDDGTLVAKSMIDNNEKLFKDFTKDPFKYFFARMKKLLKDIRK